MGRHHILDIYGVHLHLATNKRDWATLRRKLTFLGKAPTSRGLTHWALWEPKQGASVPHLVLWVDASQHVNDHLDLINTCAHEAAHGASEILEWISHSKAGDEPHAYLVGWLTQWIYEGCTA